MKPFDNILDGRWWQVRFDADQAHTPSHVQGATTLNLNKDMDLRIEGDVLKATVNYAGLIHDTEIPLRAIYMFGPASEITSEDVVYMRLEDGRWHTRLLRLMLPDRGIAGVKTARDLHKAWAKRQAREAVSAQEDGVIRPKFGG